jgi:hypothetical protein
MQPSGVSIEAIGQLAQGNPVNWLKMKPRNTTNQVIAYNINWTQPAYAVMA